MSATDRVPPCVLVIFGASGDLTERKLLPAIERLATFGRLPEQFALVGVARTEMTDEEFRRTARARPPATAAGGSAAASRRRPLRQRRLRRPGDLRTVAPTCSTSATPRGAPPATASSTSPRRRSCSATIAVKLGKAGLNDEGRGGFARVVIEKPFGWDEQSARDLYVDIASAFEESRSSASTTTSRRTPSRTCWRCASPTRSSSRSGTGPGSTTSRSPWPRHSA